MTFCSLIIGIYDSKEKWDEVKKCCEKIISSLNRIALDGMDDKEIVMHLGGDMKFILMMCGLYGAGTQKKSTCPSCNCSEPERRKNKTTHTVDKNRFKKGIGRDMKYPRIFPHIPPIRIVPDVLHILLRLTDRMFNNFVTELLKDIGDKRGMQRIEEGMAEIFNGWSFFLRAEKTQSKNAWEAKYGYTLMRGPAKRTLLRHFPKVVAISHVHDEVRREWLAKIWEEFDYLYSVLSSWPPEEETQAVRSERALTFQARMKEFVKLLNFPAKGVKGRPGYSRGGYTAVQTSTCYFHWFMNHAWEFIREYGGLAPFNMEGVEYVNNSDGHTIRTLVSGKKDIVLAELLLHNLRMYELEDEIKETEKRYTCSICNDKFTAYGRLRQHYKAHKLEQSDIESQQHARTTTHPHTSTSCPHTCTAFR